MGPSCVQALLRHTGGDRLMAQVLALCATSGLDEVLVAVELALERAGPSGRVSPEHVANVLARLTAEALQQEDFSMAFLVELQHCGDFSGGDREGAAFTAAELVFEHGLAVRVPFEVGTPSSAVTLRQAQSSNTVLQRSFQS